MSKEGVVRLKAQIQENPTQFAGMTQKQIAEMFGVGRRTVGDILAKYRVLYGLDYHNTHDGFQQAQEVEEKIFGGADTRISVRGDDHRVFLLRFSEKGH